MQLNPSLKLSFLKGKSKSKSKSKSISKIDIASNTPILSNKPILVENSIDSLPTQNLLTNFTWNQASKVKKRNNRQNSFNYYNQTECSFMDKFHTSHNNNNNNNSSSKHYNSFCHIKTDSSKDKRISTLQQLSQLATNTNTNTSINTNTNSNTKGKIRNYNKIPFQKQFKKSLQAQSNKVLFNSKLINSKDFADSGNSNNNNSNNNSNSNSKMIIRDYLQTSANLNLNLSHNKSLCFSNQFEVVSLENSSENNSNRSLTKSIQDKLIYIRNDLLALINSSNDQQKQMILKEFEKIYKGIANNTISSSIQDPIIEIEVLKAENRIIREENRALNDKVAKIEFKLIQMKKENEENNKRVICKLQSIDKMKYAMLQMTNQLMALKNESRVDNELCNDINCNINVNGNGKSNSLEGIKANKTSSKSKDTKTNEHSNNDYMIQSNKKVDCNKKRVKTNIEARYETEQSHNSENDNKKNNNNDVDEQEDTMSNISLTENLMTEINKNIRIPQTKQKLQLKLPLYKDFNSEFLQNYDEFSPSWRREADKMNRRKEK